MTEELEPLDPDQWSEEFWLGIFAWLVIPFYFAFVSIIGVGIACKFAMGKTNSFMQRWKA
jgi:hypothetical protein